MVASARIGRGVGIIGATALLAAGMVGGTSATATGTTTTITVLLKAPHPRELGRLATAQGLTHMQRVTALSRLLPSAAAHRRVVESLGSHGFTVSHETAWTIDAEAPSRVVSSVFGRSPTMARRADSRGLRTGGELPRIPAAIASVTAAVLAKSTGPAVFHPLDICSVQCHDGRDFRNAYSSPSSGLHGGSGPNGPLTIATLQFPLGGGWNQSDLTRYAQAVGLPDPVASGQYKQFAVDNAAVPPATKKEGGADEEVDLDQETILSTAPLANQRAYFDTNASRAAYADALSQVLADVTQGVGAADGGDPKIAALSTSWGACESEFSDRFAFPHDTVKAVGRILQSLTAAGVTIFAASGDDGIYDCGDSQKSTRTAVDYPASAPQVIGVGGTRLRSHGMRSRNNGHNWADTAWTCSSPRICQGMHPEDTGGSGGGESKLFRQPAYQAAGIGHDPFKTPTGEKGDFGAQRHRLVPDIAVDGDPATGFATLTTDPVDVPRCAPIAGTIPPTCKPKTFPIGGTSLSAPAAAALFTDMLAAHGATAGVGDIHGALYSAYAAHHGAFRDVRSGRNGHQGDVDRRARHHKAAEIPVTAQKGYDTVTGLGVALWPAIVRYLFDPAPPTATGSLHLKSRHHTKHTTEVTARWGARAMKRNGSAAKSAAVRIVRDDASNKRVFSDKHAAAPGSHTFRSTPGAKYTMTVVIRDLAGQHSPAIHRHLAVPRHHR